MLERETITIAQNVGRKPAVNFERTRFESRRDHGFNKSLSGFAVFSGDWNAFFLRIFDQRGNIGGDRRREISVRNFLADSSVSVAPGANANAVKELVLAGMLLAARNLAPALAFVAALDPAAEHLDKAVESGKKDFAGFELAGQTLGIVGLGKVGCLVADAAIKLGMNVLGYDPDITVDAAWSLPAQVKKAASVAEVMKSANFVSLHVPLVDATRNLVSEQNVALMKPGAVLLNFSRDGVVDDAAVLAALGAGQLGWYICDFPEGKILRHPKVVALPHLGASTREAEENCAIMVADQLRDYLEHGNIANAVNFPNVSMARESAYRVAIANANVPNMLGQISTAMAQAGLNIHNMVNKSRGDMAYTLVDVDSPASDSVMAALRAIDGVLSVRYLPQVA